jgi:transposase, IS30 family
MGYQRLTQGERYQISALVNTGMSIRSAASQLGRSPSTISRELRRNRSTNGYVPRRAHTMARGRRRLIRPRFKIQGLLQTKVEFKLRMQWSPEQISGRLAAEFGEKISHESIYQFIYREYRKGNKLYLNCRRKRKYRRARGTTRNYKNSGKRHHYPNIKERPEVVSRRERLGDFERDTIIGKHSKSKLLTIVDRVSRVTSIAKLPNLNAAESHKKTVELLKGKIVHTITNDNGQEFMAYQDTQKALGAMIYFNDPYSSWQRGTNENTNGLIRQYFPKGTNFDEVSDGKISEVEQRLNHRPRKSLGYRTPVEVERLLSQGVALRT